MGKFDLLISDIIMPEMNGFEIAEIARTVNPKMKIIFMSGCVQDLEVPQSLKTQEIPLILKPFKSDSFSQKVRLVLDDSLKCPILTKALQEI